MHEIPDCLSRRYQALDELIKELSTSIPTRGPDNDCPGDCSDNAGIKLMCNFWNILKENPDCNLTQAVQQRLGLSNSNSSGGFRPQHVTCFTASRCSHSDTDDKKRDAANKATNACCRATELEPRPRCCASKSMSPSIGTDALPLSKVLCNLKEAASFDKKCNARISDLMSAQKVLQEQIQHLEHKEKEGTQLLKQADCMWSCMEDAYKKKVAESLERQKVLLKELKEVEKSAVKWRKNKKDLESQLNGIGKCHQEITEKINQKTNDMKYMDMEITNFKKRIESNKNEIETSQKSHGGKKKASDAKIASIAENVTRLQHKLSEEEKHKKNKEQEGSKYVKEAREDLQKICRVLLQKKLENEDLRAEKEALDLEINLLRQTYDQCRDKCKNKQQSVNDEIKRIETEIADFKVKCVRCHQCTDTVDVRKYCTDCPRCLEERECLYEEDHCSPDHTMDCVCTAVKQKFLDNVFDNMYTVLERQAKAGPGRAVGDAILNCLKRSRNGKLNDDTRKILQDFILTTVKKNLNLTIVGGAVKTRCEMDPETYKQLMLCLKQVKVVKPPKTDKGTVAKKDACHRWGGTSECNCPKGPKDCICTRKAPPPPQDPKPCPPPDKEDADEVIACPHRKESAACGADCAMHAVPSNVAKEVSYRRDPCQGQSCTFSKNMRAAQCVLGPESIASFPKSYMALDPYLSDIPVLENLISCKCGSSPVKPCTCRKDLRSQPRQRMIEEVLGRYTDVSSIDNVTNLDEYGNHEIIMGQIKNKGCINMSKNKGSQYVAVASNKLFEDTEAVLESRKRSHRNRQKDSHRNKANTKSTVENFDKSDKFKNKVDTKLTVILYPRFCVTNHTIGSSPVASVTSCSSCNSKSVSSDNTVEANIVNLCPSIFGRKVCDTVKELLKDIIVSDTATDKRSNIPDIEWVTIESFLKQITLLPKTLGENSSSVTVNEVEMTNDTLDVPKEYIVPNKVNQEEAKEGIAKKCVENNYTITRVRKLDNIQPTFSIIEKEKREELYVQNHYAHTQQNKLKNDSSVEIFAKNAESQTVLGELVPNKNQFKIVIESSSGHIEDPYTELTYTSSGNLAMELDEKVIKLIERKTVETPNLFISLNKTESGHCVVNFDSKDSSNKNQKISLKESPSGATKLLEVHKDFVNTLKPDQFQSLTKIKQESQINSMPTETTTVKDKMMVIGDTRNNLLGTLHVKESEDKNTNIQYLNELKQLYEQGRKDIAIKIQGKNGVYKELQTPITRTLSGNVAVDVKNILSFGNISFKAKEHSVLLTKSNSDTYVLDICCNIEKPNTVLRKTASGGILVVVTRPFLNFKSKDITPVEYFPSEEFYKLKVQSDNFTIADLPAVLKVTSSHNYIIVLDKEFEKGYTKSINSYVEDNTECLVVLSRTSSGNYIINFVESDRINADSQSAILLKSAPGIKVLVNGPEFERLSRKGSIASGSTVFGKLLEKLPSSSREFHREHLRKSRFLSAKASSDTNVYEKVKTKVLDQKGILGESSSVIKKTTSGHYAVVLNKDTKKTLIENLKSYLANNSHGLIPIKRTKSGQMVIALNKDDETNGHYGSLKISPSGNIYVLVDEKAVAGMTKGAVKKSYKGPNIADTISQHIIGKVKDPSNKAVTTTCNSRPDDCSCDALKCVCKELQSEISDWIKDGQETDKKQNESKSIGLSGPQNLTKLKRLNGRKKYNYPKMCAKNRKNGNNKNLEEKSPHIVIKPSACISALEKNPKTTEQCLYFVEAVCPYHINRYEVVSNELLKVSGLCNKEPKKSKKPLRAKHQNQSELKTTNWDSLNYLPPQLPSFLKDVSYK